MNQIKQTLHSLPNDEPLCVYLYDLGALQKHAQSMVNLLPANTELFYAAKANPDAKILATLQPIVHGFEAASGGELHWLKQCHPKTPTIFGGPGKLKSELTKALQSGVEAIHVESQTELLRLSQVAESLGCQVPIFLRMNISLEGIASTRLAMGGKPSPFGFDCGELSTALSFIANHSRLDLTGFHFHLLSHQLSDENHLKLIRLYFRTFKDWCRTYKLSIPTLNVGGGMGINYLEPSAHFNWPRFCDNLGELIETEEMQNTLIRFESGRFVTAQCGYYVMEVLDIKSNHGNYFAIGRGGTHHFRTPAAQGHSHPFFIVEGKNREVVISNVKVTIVGQLCTPKDILVDQQPVDSLAIGDFIVFPLAGAYAWNISHQNFLMHPPPQIHYLT